MSTNDRRFRWASSLIWGWVRGTWWVTRLLAPKSPRVTRPAEQRGPLRVQRPVETRLIWGADFLVGLTKAFSQTLTSASSSSGLAEEVSLSCTDGRSSPGRF